MQVERGVLASVDTSSGERVSNALVTCPEGGDNSSKGLLIPDDLSEARGLERKAAMRFGRGLRPIS